MKKNFLILLFLLLVPLLSCEGWQENDPTETSNLPQLVASIPFNIGNVYRVWINDYPYLLTWEGQIIPETAYRRDVGARRWGCFRRDRYRDLPHLDGRRYGAERRKQRSIVQRLRR